jgi:micrococcal nuclease
VAVIALLILLVVRYFDDAERRATPSEPLVEGMHAVDRVVDGDTIIFAQHSVVRLIGVDAPETVKPEHPVEPLGPEASAFTRRFLSLGVARLEFDRERVDRFGRFLAYVYVGDRLLNEELLREGLARWESHFHYSAAMKARFKRAQQEAQRAERGIWSRMAPSGQKGAQRGEREQPFARERIRTAA